MTILDKKTKIQSIVNVFETGTIEGDYGNISIFADGPNDIRQITYGKSQTTEWGNLSQLINDYIHNNGQYAEELKPYANRIGKTSLVNESNFINILRKAGSDPIMIQTQDAFFDRVYWAPAYKFMQDNKFTLPLAGLVIYDSYIHSGSIPMFLRTRFRERTPANGGDEKNWIKEYLETRKQWLETHSRPILRKTVYRVKNMIAAMNRNNWDLDDSFNANGTIVS